MGSTISRNVLAVVSYSEDSETGYLSSITLQTSQAPEEELFNSEADVFVNGSFALIPKADLQENRNSSRLNWHRYLKKAHDAREYIRRQAAARLRNTDCGGDGSDLQCKFGVKFPGYSAEVRYVKSNSFFCEFHSHVFAILTHLNQLLIYTTSITIPQTGNQPKIFCRCLEAARHLMAAEWFSGAKTVMLTPALRSSSGTEKYFSYEQNSRI
jgi:hypothetical protein